MYSCRCFTIKTVCNIKLSYLTPHSHLVEMFTTIFIKSPQGCNKNKRLPIGQGEHCIPPLFYPTPPRCINNNMSLRRLEYARQFGFWKI